MWPSPMMTIRKMIRSLRRTIHVLTVADSLISITSTVDISTTMKTAGRLIHAPVKTSPAFRHPATPAVTLACVHHCVGEPASCAGNVMPKLLSSDTKCPDQPTPTVAAPVGYYTDRTQPLI